ncbi:MAG: PD40 domain-containing protein [Anaerolineales bacterium]|nr:PD40 domain-containing protein [Anaerolineales bacterium]
MITERLTGTLAILLTLWVTGCNRVSELTTPAPTVELIRTSSATSTAQIPPAMMASPDQTSGLQANLFANSQTPSPTIDNTLTPVPETGIQEFPSPIPDQGVQQKCALIEQADPSGTNLEGTLILGVNPLDEYGDIGEVYTMSMNNLILHRWFTATNQIDLFPMVGRISPNFQRYLYFEPLPTGEGSQLHIATITGQEIPVAYWEATWGSSAEWLDDRRIIIWPSRTVEQDLGTAVVLDPLSGQWQQVNPDFPSGINNWIPMVSYSPDLSHAIYLSGNDFVLLDLQSRQDSWRKDGVYFYQPLWSPDGSQAAMIFTEPEGSLSNLFLVTLDGQEVQLTRFQDAYPSVSEIYIEKMAWSPDGRYIAFLVLVGNGDQVIKGPTLMVVDIDSRQVMDYCMIASRYHTGNIVWSSDSLWLAVASPLEYDKYLEVAPKGERFSQGTFLINIADGLAMQIAENVIPLGWMVSP